VTRVRVPRTLLAACLVGGLAAACNTAPDDQTVPAERRGPTSTYVALGGDDVAGGRGRLGNTWPHVLFRAALPRTATFVDVADPRSGIEEIRSEQLERAVDAEPDVVTITVLDDAERITDPAIVERELTAVLAALTARDATRVFVGTVPDDAASPTTVSALNDVIHAVAGDDAHVEVVDLASVGHPDTIDGATRTAQAFARALRSAGISPARSP
jgi:hypothetical protein